MVDLRGLIPTMATALRARFPSVKFPEQVAISWVSYTAKDTHAAQGSAFLPGPEIAARALTRSLDDLGCEVSPSAAIALVHSVWRDFIPQARFHEDATPELFRNLRSRVRAMGIITDSDTSSVNPLLHRLGAFSLFDVVVVSDSVGAYKPDPRIYRAALEQAKVRSEDSLFVSDSLVDLEGGREVGLGPVWIARDRKADQIPDLPGITVISRLTDLLRLVAGTGNGLRRPTQGKGQ